ncbi:40S ribosomal protein S22 [Verticillium dahliae VDG2]|nr:40S ribosomal protein S22 [Verticillium dahliae VDG2]
MSGLISIQSPSQWQDVLNSTNVVVADFYADWCGPCNAIAPHFEKMANEYSKPKKAAFCKINVDTQSTISRAHGVSAMPTFIIFHAGKPIETIRGANPPALATAIDPLQAAEKSSFNLVNPPARDAARGAGPGGKARAPPARPSAFRTLADLGKDE